MILLLLLSSVFPFIAGSVEISLVISAIGGPDLDGEREDVSWIARNLSTDIHIYHHTREISKTLYQRTKRTKLHFIGNVNGNDCLAYLKFIISNYDSLPKAVFFTRADAINKCPTIKVLLEKSGEELSDMVHDPRRHIPGYMSLSKVLLNQSRPYLLAFNYPMVEFANSLTIQRCEYLRELANQIGSEVDPCSNMTLVNSYPEYITVYPSGSFAVSRDNILRYPLQFYRSLFQKIYHGNSNDRTCGMMEYLWSAMWGGKPFETIPDFDRPCGPLYHADLASEYGFVFFKSEDGELERLGRVPRGYNGYVINPSKNLYPPGYKGYQGAVGIDRTEL